MQQVAQNQLLRHNQKKAMNRMDKINPRLQQNLPPVCRLDDKFRLTGKLMAKEGDLARGVWHYVQVGEEP